MNSIYIINDIYSIEIKLNFNNNTFELNNKKYKFEFFKYDIIKIYWSIDNIQLFITKDSYLYYTNIKDIDIIKKIHLIHNEWYEQAIINTEKNELFRIKSKGEIGTYIIENDLLKIIWNKWGEELYIKYDNYTYIKDKIYNKYILKKKCLNKYIPIHIFMHVCCIGDNWKEIFMEQINIIKKSGLYNIIIKIHIGILGDINNIKDDIFKNEKIEIEYIDKKICSYEINTINSIKYFCQNNREEEVYILYIHTKGVRKAGNENVIKSWRNMMHYFLIEKYIDCIKNLNEYDTLGCNLVNEYCVNNNDSSINMEHNYHYSGNFWWSKKTYIDKLSYLPLDLTKNSINTRYKAENWLLSNIPDANVGILYQDDTNTHPYHRYVFDIYKDTKFLIKDIIK